MSTSKAVKSKARVSHHNKCQPSRSLSPATKCNPSPVDPASSRAFLDLDYFSSDYSCCGTTFATAFASHCCTSHFSLRYCIHCGTTFATHFGAALLTAPPKRWAPAFRSVRASANDKFVESEAVAPRVTPVAAREGARNGTQDVNSLS